MGGNRAGDSRRKFFQNHKISPLVPSQDYGIRSLQMPGTLQEVRDQREEAVRNSVANLKALATECKKLSTKSAQHYAKLAEDPMLKREEVQLQEALQQSYTL